MGEVKKKKLDLATELNGNTIEGLCGIFWSRVSIAVLNSEVVISGATVTISIHAICQASMHSFCCIKPSYKKKKKVGRKHIA